MSAPVWNAAKDKVTIPNGSAVSPSFSAPNNALGVLFWIPQSTASTTLRIEALQPKDGDQDADSYEPLVTVLTGAAAITQSGVTALDTTAAAKAFGMDAGVLGAGVFRFKSRNAADNADANQTADLNIRILWRVDQDRHK